MHRSMRSMTIDSMEADSPLLATIDMLSVSISGEGVCADFSPTIIRRDARRRLQQALRSIRVPKDLSVGDRSGAALIKRIREPFKRMLGPDFDTHKDFERYYDAVTELLVLIQKDPTIVPAEIDFQVLLDDFTSFLAPFPRQNGVGALGWMVARHLFSDRRWTAHVASGAKVSRRTVRRCIDGLLVPRSVFGHFTTYLGLDESQSDLCLKLTVLSDLAVHYEFHRVGASLTQMVADAVLSEGCTLTEWAKKHHIRPVSVFRIFAEEVDANDVEAFLGKPVLTKLAEALDSSPDAIAAAYHVSLMEGIAQSFAPPRNPPVTFTNEFQDLLRSEIDANEWTLDGAATEIGCSVGTVRDLLGNPLYMPNLRTLLPLAGYFGVSLMEIRRMFGTFSTGDQVLDHVLQSVMRLTPAQLDRVGTYIEKGC